MATPNSDYMNITNILHLQSQNNLECLLSTLISEKDLRWLQEYLH